MMVGFRAHVKIASRIVSYRQEVKITTLVGTGTALDKPPKHQATKPDHVDLTTTISEEIEEIDYSVFAKNLSFALRSLFYPKYHCICNNVDMWMQYIPACSFHLR